MAEEASGADRWPRHPKWSRASTLPLTIMVTLGIVFAAVGGFFLYRSRREAAPPTPRPFASSRAWFQEVAREVGIHFRHQSGHGGRYYMPESMAGGVCLLDYDGDGFLDAYFVQAGRITTVAEGEQAADSKAANGNPAGGSLPPREDASPPPPRTPGNQLYRNNGDGTFTEVTDQARVGDTGYGMGCACGDVDNDGLTDLYVTNVGPNVLYRNNGDGSFTDVTSSAGVGDRGFGSSAAMVDFDHDGDLDLFVVNYVRWSIEHELVCTTATGRADYCMPRAYAAPARDALFQNNGHGIFREVTASSGVAENFGNGLGVVCGDFNGDGWTDVYVANDMTANQLWINQGPSAAVRFREAALEYGVAYNGVGLAEAGMGVDAQDIDMDGDLDIFVTHLGNQTNTLYVNEGAFFTDGTMDKTLMSSLPFTGFGTAITDLNNDGCLDLFVANGRVIAGRGEYAREDPYAEPNQLFEGLTDGTYREVMPRGGTAEPLVHSSRGAAFGDFDNDGRLDIFVVNRDGPAYVLRNQANPQRHWITFRVINEHGADAIGARVAIQVAGQQRIREVRAAYSYCSSSDPRVHFGLGEASRVDAVQIAWPDGSIRTFGAFEADQIVELRPEGTQVER